MTDFIQFKRSADIWCGIYMDCMTECTELCVM